MPKRDKALFFLLDQFSGLGWTLAKDVILFAGFKVLAGHVVGNGSSLHPRQNEAR